MQNEIDVPLILAAVKKAGDLFLPDFRKNSIPEDRSVFMEMLADIETRCLNSLQTSLAEPFPDTPWLGEEFDYNEQKRPLDMDEYWLCDSMDGAVQYMQHLTGWTINLVLIRKGLPYFAAIYDPYGQEMFWARRGDGAYLNGNRIKPAGKMDFKLMLAVFEHTFPGENAAASNKKTGESVTDLLNNFGVIRNYGPHGLQLAYVGAGRIDVFYQLELDTYNWLAGILIAGEAGAEILTADGRPWSWGEESLLVAGPGIGEKFLSAKSQSYVSQPTQK